MKQTVEDDMEAHNWNYYIIFSFSKKNAGCVFILQSKQQYQEAGQNLPSFGDNMFVHHFLLTKPNVIRNR